MTVQYQFTNSQNWELAYSTSVTAQSVQEGLERFYPIEPITPGITFESDWLTVFVANPEARDTWRLGCRVFAKIRTGLTQNGGTPETVLRVTKLYLNQIELIQIPKFSTTYSLTFEIPYWHREFQIAVWEYQGDNRNTTIAKLDQLLVNTAP